ncbi:hypothetical protein LCGC14_0474090 [marine sediment metagenome]|uniref:Uncharacterized protein n=1 Tax=marine sediment metagenome TaxID=412755 RepID=A0A0F9SGL9_9ZZZZ|nr:hypothetical protein [bacterium]
MTPVDQNSDLSVKRINLKKSDKPYLDDIISSRNSLEEIPSIEDFSAFKSWILNRLESIENIIDKYKHTTYLVSVRKEKLPSKKQKTNIDELKELEKVPVDITNILYENKDESGNLKVQNIMIIENLLVSKGYDPVFIADASTIYHVDYDSWFKKLVDNKTIIQQVAGKEADVLVLQMAK